MAEISYPLDNTDYLAKNLRLWHIGRTSGVINATGNDFQTKAGTGMKTIVSEGYAYVRTGTSELGGVVYGNDDSIELSHDPANALLDRYDAIVLRYSSTENETKIVVVKGSESSNPTRYQPVRNETTYELILKYVKINHGISSITDDLIEDSIMDDDVCGIAVDSLANLPTKQYEEQIKAWLENSESEFISWFENVKGQLGEDAAGNLQNQIDQINEYLEKAIFFK